jgi:hypothetical protein
MNDDNTRNLLYFEASSMKGLFTLMEEWQHENKKRLLSASVERDSDMFCCIALTNPTEVVIVNGFYSSTRDSDKVEVHDGALLTVVRPVRPTSVVIVSGNSADEADVIHGSLKTTR